MCGIAGVYEYGRAVGRVTSETVTRMRDTLGHRGPDGAGVHVSEDGRVGLGHRRLAIVDLSHGMQPMFGEDGECLVFNGEIYNYPALRRELEGRGARFRTDCDTEVILHAYRHYGDACVERLTGMFAFALWDPGAERLLFARDPVGEKPFYWTVQDGTFLFASETKALLAHPRVTAEVNTAVLESYLANLVVPSPATLYRGINKLPPGTAGTCDARGVRTWRYRDLAAGRTFLDVSLSDAAERVRTLLQRSVQARLMSDVPVGVLLSGGFDSTSLVALLRDRAEGTSTFSVGFGDAPELDERHEARWVARHFGTDHHEVTVSPREALETLAAMVHHQDEPLADPVCMPLGFVCALARQRGVPVVLAGEGADELFWGYPTYSRVMRRQRELQLFQKLPAGARRLLTGVVPRSRRGRAYEILAGAAAGRQYPMHFPLCMPTTLRSDLLIPRQYDPPLVRPPLGDGETGLQTVAFDTQHYEFSLRLPELLLMRIDRFSMAHSVEARVPFLDPELVEFAYRLPVHYKVDRDRTKVVLRQALADIVPERVMKRRKQGFGAPIAHWLRGPMGDALLDLLDSPAMGRYFRTRTLAEMAAEHRAGRAQHAWSLWPVLNFAVWHRVWVEGVPADELTDRMMSRCTVEAR
ncbi:asparagine synthase (glutamine-hydrolyzing) [Streptomyces hygroscopicus]|uniref:asparagine synthase (glutamine-hydrolyzing) n=1 Tax=Streptomyces hygroscopicus TaxID=1912 RepID=UPI00223EAED3|nr:asparagine synthase (glutamine-hydrolyzing) [Streptomyces hygroscopicus]